MGTKLFVTLLLISNLFANYATAENIIIFGNANKPPKNFLDSNGKPTGILIEIMKKVELELGDVRFIFKLYPWKRAYSEAKNGKGGIISFSKTKPRLKIFDYSEPMYYDDIMVVTKNDTSINYENINDLSGKIVGFGDGYSFGDEFEKAIDNEVFKASTDNGPTQRLQKLLRGRIDAALIGPGKFAIHIAINGNDELRLFQNSFKIHPVPFKRDPNFLGFAKSMNKTDFLKRFNEVLEVMWSSGLIDSMSDVGNL